MTFGTLDVVKEGNEELFTINAEYEVELMIERLIPSHHNLPLRVRIHPENTRLIRMIMKEFPLEIKTDRWQEFENEIAKKEELAKTLEKLEYVQPDKGYFTGQLLPFQQQGLDFLIKTSGNTLVTDEMGLGKTIETIAYISQNVEKMPIVIIAPLVTLINWKRELEKFLRIEWTNAKQMKLDQVDKPVPIINLIRSGEAKRLPVADIHIINYDLVARRIKDLINIKPKLVVFDEIQFVRNISTGRYIACKTLASTDSVEHRIGLSGTPIYNRGIEMYNICELIKPGLLGEREEFVRRYCRAWYADNITTDEGKAGLANLLKKSIMIRRKKTEVLKDLPEKIKMKQTIQINHELYHQKLSELLKKINMAKEELNSKVLVDEKKEGLFELNKKIREMRIQERQIAGIAKAPFVLKYLETLLEDYDEEKFVVFCHHISVHEIIFNGLYKYNPVQIIGGQNDKERQNAIDKFQNDKKTRVVICGLRAGNIGINLTSSAYVVFAELDWSPSVHKQAEDRLHRIGQKHTVFAHYLEGAGTFDEVLSQILLNKTVVINDVLGDKMERLNNQKALEYLEEKFKISESDNLIKLTQEFVPDVNTE